LPAWAVPQPALIFGGVGLIALATFAAIRARRVDPATGLVAIMLAALAATAVRHQGLFFVGGAFLAAEAMADLERAGPPARAAASKAAAAAIGCLLASAWCIWPSPSGPLRPRQGPYTFGVGLETDRFPVGAVDRIEAARNLGPLYNDVAFGGYVLWRAFPPRKVFIDGRNEVDPTLLRDLARARSDSREWEALLDRHGVDGALVRYDDRLRRVVTPAAKQGGNPTVGYHTSNALLFPKTRFALVYWDDAAMLFVRRTPEREGWLAEEEYRFVHPEDRLATVEAATDDRGFLEAALAELRRRLSENPDCERARRLQEQLSRIEHFD
jgi:hypothetical protein